MPLRFECTHKKTAGNVHQFHFGFGLAIGKYARSMESGHIDTKHTQLYSTRIKRRKKCQNDDKNGNAVLFDGIKVNPK